MSEDYRRGPGTAAEYEQRARLLERTARATTRICPACQLPIEDPLLTRHADCPAPAIACRTCGKDPIGRIADHYMRPAPDTPSECERIRGGAL